MNRIIEPPMPDWDAIPEAMKQETRWVLWRSQKVLNEKTGKWKHDKVPVSPYTGLSVNPGDPCNWLSFEEAQDLYRKSVYGGIGFALGDGWAGIDMDSCINADGYLDWGIIKPGINLSPELAPDRIVETFEAEAYIEYSPSGNGLHIITKGELPPGGRKLALSASDDVKKELACYDYKRFFTITGRKIAGNCVLADTTEKLKRLHSLAFPQSPVSSRSADSGSTVSALGDDDLIERASHAKDGDKFQRLWEGSHNGYPSQSEADLALCNILAFWTGRDVSRMDQLFRQSGLMREKWKREDYREGTIARACESTVNTYSPHKPRTEIDTHRNGATVPTISEAEPLAVVNARNGSGAIAVLQEPDFNSAEEPPLDALVEQSDTIEQVKTEHQIAADDLDSPALDTGTPALYLGEESLNDHGNAQRLIALYGKDLRYCHDWKSWLAWDGCRWELDTTGQARRKAKLSMSEFYQQAVKAGKAKAEKFAIASHDEKRISSLLKMAESDIYVKVSQLDTHAYLINFKNGTIDVCTGQLREHKRSDFITKLIPHNYNPKAKAPLWLEFLNWIMGGGANASEGDLDRADRLVDYLQRALGYSLTGDVTEKAVFMCFGDKGDNGKSTLLTTVWSLIEEYATTLDISTLMVKQENNNSQSDMANLRGRRFVQTSETEDGQRLAVGKLKKITQGMKNGKISATPKYQNKFEFPETHKTWMDCNHRPIIPANEKAIWNRLHPIPFTVQIPKDEIDRRFPEKLEKEAEGILAWLVAGAIDWKQHGLPRPPEIDTALSEYRSEMDPFKDFLKDCCNVGVSFTCQSSPLYKAYVAWAIENNVSKVIDNKAFKHSMEARSFVYKDQKTGMIVHGLSLKPRGPQAADVHTTSSKDNEN